MDNPKINYYNISDDSKENLVEMNFENWKLNDETSFKYSEMELFDEDILEEEISEADAKLTYTPWTLIWLGVGVVLLVTVVIVLLLVVVNLWYWCSKKKKTGFEESKVCGGQQYIDLTLLK